MFSFALTSGLASDSDKFKIIKTLHRAQTFRDTGPYKNLICCLLSGFVCCLLFVVCFVVFFVVFCCLLFVVCCFLGEDLRKEVGLLMPGPRGPGMLWH